MHKTIQTGLISSLASEGQGIVRLAGKVTFIPFTAVGDEINYQIVQSKKNFDIGKLLKIIQPSQERALPKCPYFGVCGGCQLQHITYAAQLEHKRKWVEDALRKIGKFQEAVVPAVIPAHLQWSYRRRVNLLLKRHQANYQAGYIATDNQSLLTVESCPIFTETKDLIFKAVQEMSGKLISCDPSNGKATILKNGRGYIVHFHFRTMPQNLCDILCNYQKIYPFLTGILATSQRKSFQFGTIETDCIIEGLSFNFTPRIFIQNHPEQSLNIYKMIETLAKEAQPQKVLDLYCGVGISTLLLARLGCQIQGVELNAKAIEMAKINAKKNGLDHAQFIIADVEQALPQLLENDPDFIIANPPREGLSPKAVQILSSKPAKTLVYISCMPSTLARDLKLLCENGYKLSRIQAYDMFPQTVHIETLVVLRASSKS